MRREVGRVVLILLAAIAVGYLMLTASYLIRPQAFENHFKTSARQLASEAVRPTERLSGRQLDNFTDALMLLEVGYEGEESALVKAANTPYSTLPGLDPYETVTQMPRRPKTFLQPNSYSRYWHGYQIFTRPLMLLFDYRQIRTLNAVALCALAALVTALMLVRARDCAIPFLLTLALLGPTAIAKSLQYSSVTYVMLLALAALLLRRKARAEYVFLLSGIAVAYLDLLTFPTVALTMPLVLLCAMEGREARLRAAIRCAIFWAVGYGGMWAGKWLIALVFNGRGFFDDLLGQMKLRAGATDWAAAKVSRAGTVLKNLRALFEGQWVPGILSALCAGVYVARDIRAGIRWTRRAAADFAVRLVPAAIALMWVIAMANHSHVHTFFTYRTMAPCVFCLLCALQTREGCGPAEIRDAG